MSLARYHPLMPTPYPLILKPILKPKVWGGRRLAEFGKHLPPEGHIGESWELADLDTTSTSGGGGEPAHSTILNAELQGKTIRDAIEQWGTDLLGDAKPTPGGGFPLLVKYLDASQHLSIQVHPSPAYAEDHPEAHLKAESWLILDAQPDADGNQPVIYKGFQDGTTADDLRDAIKNGTVPDIMRTQLAVPGHCHTLPSGTVHALGAGVLVAEIQTPSDTTFRVYDWAKEYGREGRELHTEQAVQCASFEQPPVAQHAEAFLAEDLGMMSTRPPQIGQTRHRVADTDHYTIDIISASCASVAINQSDDTRNTPAVLMLLKTTGASIATKDEEHPLEAGQTVLIPAALVNTTTLRAGPGTEALIARVV